MRLDIDTLTEAELIDLNNRIVARLHFLHTMRAHSQMLQFTLGERVVFQPEGRTLLVGTLTRYNKKSVTVITEMGERWNVSPSLLRKLVSGQAETTRPEKSEEPPALAPYKPE